MGVVSMRTPADGNPRSVTDDGRVRVGRDQKGLYIESHVRGSGGVANFQRYLGDKEIAALIAALEGLS